MVTIKDNDRPKKSLDESPQICTKFIMLFFVFIH